MVIEGFFSVPLVTFAIVGIVERGGRAEAAGAAVRGDAHGNQHRPAGPSEQSEHRRAQCAASGCQQPRSPTPHPAGRQR
jgi:hypothetical protein